MHDPEGEMKALFPANRLSTAEIRALLAKKHNTTLPDDDPILMMVTIFNALLDKCEASQRELLDQVVDRFADDLERKLEPITSEALKTQMGGVMAKMREEGEQVARIISGFRRLGFWVGVMVFVNVTVSLINIYQITN